MRRSILSLLFLLLPMCLSTLAFATAEAELRAAVIYNIARFVHWPPGTGSERFNICAVGRSDVADALATLEGKSINGVATAVRTVRHDRDLFDCHLLYIAPDEARRTPAINETLAKQHAATLTISDAPTFLAQGGMVQLVVVEDRQRFRINRDLAEKANLSINSKLLHLALPRD